MACHEEIAISAYDCVIVGCGFTGATLARELAQRGQMRVLILEQRNHIGGNCYDYVNGDGILVHAYGPHIFHTNNERVYQFLSRFTAWRPYTHTVVGAVHGKLLPIPFNLNTLQIAFDDTETQARLTRKLIAQFGLHRETNIGALRAQADADMQALAAYIYAHIYRHYTEKQWGCTPEQLDETVLQRVPIRVSTDNAYFTDTFQGIPAHGYTGLFTRMLTHPNITVALNYSAKNLIADKKLYVSGQPLPPETILIYTGTPDALFDYCFGELPYRAMRFVYETHAKAYYQPCATVNYTVSEAFTRITEYKYLTGQQMPHTTIAKEYATAYKRGADESPSYPVLTPENTAMYARYKNLADDITGLYLAGRLAEYRYYNMDDAVARALTLADQIVAERGDTTVNKQDKI